MMTYFKSEGSGGVDDNLLMVSPVGTDMCRETNVVKGPKTKIIYNFYATLHMLFVLFSSSKRHM